MDIYLQLHSKRIILIQCIHNGKGQLIQQIQITRCHYYKYGRAVRLCNKVHNCASIYIYLVYNFQYYLLLYLFLVLVYYYKTSAIT